MLLFIIGFLFMIYGNFFIISYMKLLNTEYNIFRYIAFLLHRGEVYFLFIGLFLVLLSLRKKG